MSVHCDSAAVRRSPPSASLGGPAGKAADAGLSRIRVLVVAAHPDYEALALDELTRGGFRHASRLVTSVDELRAALAVAGVDDLWDIALLIDTPDGPSAAASLELLAAATGEMPVIAIGRGPVIAAPPDLASLRTVELRSLAGAAADALRELERRRERRRGAQALRASEIRFSTVFDSAPSGLALVRVDGRFLAVNPVFCAIARRERDEVVNASADEVAADDLLACVRAAALRAAHGDRGEPVERRAVRADGTPCWVRMSAAPAYDDAGEIAYLVAHVEDATARREAEEGRDRSDALFEAVFSASNVGISVADQSGRYVATNAAFEAFVGYTGEELRSLRIHDITYPDDVEAHIALRRERLDAGFGYRTEKRYVRKDGTVVWAVLSVAPLGEGLGEWLSVGSIVDITERKQAEAALEESARTFGAACSLARLASWASTKAHAGAELELEWSPEMFRIFGLEPGEQPPTAELFRAAVHPDDRERVMLRVAETLAGARADDVEFRVLRPDGEIRWVRVRADHFPGAQGGSRLVGVMLDITGERIALAELDSTERALSALLRPRSQAMAVVDVARGVVVWANPGLAELVGQSAAELTGLEAVGLLHPDDRGWLRSALAGVTASPGHEWSELLRLARRDGACAPAEVTVNGLRGAGRAVVRVTPDPC